MTWFEKMVDRHPYRLIYGPSLILMAIAAGVHILGCP